MLVRRYQDLIAWKTGDQFKAEVFRLVLGSPAACRDLRFKSQILDAAAGVPANIVEGFLRFSPREFARFLDYCLGCLGEAEARLRDAIQLGYVAEPACASAFKLARRCLTATVRLKKSQERFRK